MNYSFSILPQQSAKDGMFRIRVAFISKGVIGQVIEKVGFLKFESQEEAQAAYETLESGDVVLKVGAKQANTDLYDIEVALTTNAGITA
jgi:hypothetical protein